MGFLEDRSKAKELDQLKANDGFNKAYQQGVVNGQDSLATKLVEIANERRANAVANRQQEALLDNIQTRLVNGDKVTSEELALFTQATQGGVGVPTADKSGQPVSNFGN